MVDPEDEMNPPLILLLIFYTGSSTELREQRVLIFINPLHDWISLLHINSPDRRERRVQSE